MSGWWLLFIVNTHYKLSFWIWSTKMSDMMWTICERPLVVVTSFVSVTRSASMQTSLKFFSKTAQMLVLNLLITCGIVFFLPWWLNAIAKFLQSEKKDNCFIQTFFRTLKIQVITLTQSNDKLIKQATLTHRPFVRQIICAMILGNILRHSCDFLVCTSASHSGCWVNRKVDKMEWNQECPYRSLSPVRWAVSSRL